MNNKGFMMAEVVVVASIVLIAMAGLYTSYNKIISIYNQRVDYYDVATLYELGNYKKNSLPGLVRTSPVYGPIDGKSIYYVSKDNLKKYKNNNNIFDASNQTLKDYFNFLSNSLEFDSAEFANVVNILIMERCIEGNKDNCKYAYLEVFNSEVMP